jgi:16S rRNA U516 pseudouridylate synthase RsuA-like enzyme
MPYYIYKITAGPTALVKTLEKLEQYDSFKEAKTHARNMRADISEGDSHQIKVMFAETELEAEEKLMEKREAPILREWEK